MTIKTMTITSIEDAIERLIETQVEQGGIPTQPAFADTIENEAGWAFFNVNGYLGTVTVDGELIFEDEFVTE
jgi:hypothetical protein